MWTVETLNDKVDEELDALPPHLRGRFLWIMDRIELVGIEQMREPHVKHLDGKLWELRVKTEEGAARGLYITVSGRRVIILHIFVKKSQKTPKTALNIARERMKTVQT